MTTCTLIHILIALGSKTKYLNVYSTGNSKFPTCIRCSRFFHAVFRQRHLWGSSKHATINTKGEIKWRLMSLDQSMANEVSRLPQTYNYNYLCI